MKKPPVDLVIFDLGRVLVDFDFMKVITRLKRYTPLHERQIRRYFYTTPLWDAFERGRVSPEDFFKSLKKHLRLKNLHYKDFAPLWNQIFTEKHDTVSILRRLRGRCRLAILSNVNVLHWEHILERHTFMEWFDHPIASYAVGYRKPDLEIYRHTLRAANVAPQRAIFVDDVLSHIAAARNVGIQAYQFFNAPQLIRDLDGLLNDPL